MSGVLLSLIQFAGERFVEIVQCILLHPSIGPLLEELSQRVADNLVELWYEQLTQMRFADQHSPEEKTLSDEKIAKLEEELNRLKEEMLKLVSIPHLQQPLINENYNNDKNNDLANDSYPPTDILPPALSLASTIAGCEALLLSSELPNQSSPLTGSVVSATASPSRTISSPLRRPALPPLPPPPPPPPPPAQLKVKRKEEAEGCAPRITSNRLVQQKSTMSLADLLKGAGGASGKPLPLRKVILDRSPGGTPKKKRGAVGSPKTMNDMIALALKKKFDSLRKEENSPSSSSSSSSKFNTSSPSSFSSDDDDWGPASPTRLSSSSSTLSTIVSSAPSSSSSSSPVASATASSAVITLSPPRSPTFSSSSSFARLAEGLLRQENISSPFPSPSLSSPSLSPSYRLDTLFSSISSSPSSGFSLASVLEQEFQLILPENPSPATFLSEDLQVISPKGVEEEKEEREAEETIIEQNEDGKENEEPSQTLLAKKNGLKKTTTSSSVLPLVGPIPTPFSLAVQLRRTNSKKNINNDNNSHPGSNNSSTGNVFIPQLRKTGIRRT